ncbi:MAG TPA: flagellar hook-basal body complex protein, partial [Bacilli bacterium]|nr:flagellar hook-basal body complex protein [Bacilli bacterium]
MNTQMIQASVTMGQLQRKLDTISHNMANINTHGFKRREASFSDLLFQQLNNNLVTEKEVGRLTPNGLRVGSGAKIGQMALRVEQGPLQRTDRELDVALAEKKQYFQIQNGDGQVRYTRNGAFYLSQSVNNPGQLNLVTGDGNF